MIKTRDIARFGALIFVVLCTVSCPKKEENNTSSGGGTTVQTQSAGLTVEKTGAGGGTVASSPAGIDCGSDCTEPFVQNSTITLTATPDSTSSFTGWDGGGCSGTGDCAVVLDSTKTVKAGFAKVNKTLTVAKAGAGTGTVTSDPAGISCGTDCAEAYTVNTGVALTATADSNSLFAGWSGGGCSGTGNCSVTLSSDTTVTATFNLNTYTLTVNKVILSGGANCGVTSAPAGIDCGSDCAEPYASGTSVTLTRQNLCDSFFGGWSGCDSTSGMDCTVIMNSTKTVTLTEGSPS